MSGGGPSTRLPMMSALPPECSRTTQLPSFPSPLSCDEHAASGFHFPPPGIIYGALGLNKESILWEENHDVFKILFIYLFLRLAYGSFLVTVPQCVSNK